MAEMDATAVGFLSYFTDEGIGDLGWIGVYEANHAAAPAVCSLVNLRKS